MIGKLNSQGADDNDDVKKTIAILGNKQRLLSIDMETKVVQHVLRIVFNALKVFKFSITFKLWIYWFPAPV